MQIVISFFAVFSYVGASDILSSCWSIALSIALMYLLGGIVYDGMSGSHGHGNASLDCCGRDPLI